MNTKLVDWGVTKLKDFITDRGFDIGSLDEETETDYIAGLRKIVEYIVDFSEINSK